MKQFFIGFVLVATVLSFSQIASGQVELQLGFLVDGSATISASDFQIATDALARVITEQNLIPNDGSVEITVVQFSNQIATVEISPTILTNASAPQIAQRIRAISQGGGGTPLWLGIDRITDLIVSSPNYAQTNRQAINVITDGEPQIPNNGIFISEGIQRSLDARNNAINRGIDELDAEGVGNGTDVQQFQNFLLDLVWPQPGVLFVNVNDPFVPGFVTLVDSFQDLEEAVRNKVVRILSSINGNGQNNDDEPGRGPGGAPIPFDSPTGVFVLIIVMGLLIWVLRHRQNLSLRD